MPEDTISDPKRTRPSVVAGGGDRCVVGSWSAGADDNADTTICPDPAHRRPPVRVSTPGCGFAPAHSYTPTMTWSAATSTGTNDEALLGIVSVSVYGVDKRCAELSERTALVGCPQRKRRKVRHKMGVQW